MILPKSVVGVIADAYTVFVIALSTNAFLTLLIGGNDPAKASLGSPYFRFAWAFVYATTLISACRCLKSFLTMARTNKPLLGLVFLTFVSAGWSIEPAATLHGAVILLFTTLFAMDMCIRYSISKQIQLIFIALGLVVLLSVIVEVFFSGLVPGLSIEEGAWHGAFGTKNEFARVVAVSVAAFLALRHSPLAKALAVIAGAGMAVLARSMGGLLYLSSTVALAIWLPVLSWRPKPRQFTVTSSAILALSITLFAGYNFATITQQMGRDPRLTGRTILWKLALADVRERPVLGYGYSAFWDENSQPARLIREASNWEDAPHSHNGYIDLALGLGLVGLGFYAIVFCTICRRAYLFFMQSEESGKQWPLAYLALVTLYQLTESSIVTGDSMVWILYCCILFSLSPMKRQEPARRMLATQQLAA